MHLLTMTEELQKINPALDRAKFDAQFQKVMAASEQALPATTSVHGTEVAQFGGGAVVLKLERGPFVAANQQIWEQTLQMLRDLGIEDPAKYINGNPKSNLYHMHPDRFTPHITIGKVDPTSVAPEAIGKPIVGAPAAPAAPIKSSESYVGNTKKKPEKPVPAAASTAPALGTAA